VASSVRRPRAFPCSGSSRSRSSRARRRRRCRAKSRSDQLREPAAETVRGWRMRDLLQSLAARRVREDDGRRASCDRGYRPPAARPRRTPPRYRGTPVTASTTSRASRSASMISAPSARNVLETVLLPVAIPPVRPTRETGARARGRSAGRSEAPGGARKRPGGGSEAPRFHACRPVHAGLDVDDDGDAQGQRVGHDVARERLEASISSRGASKSTRRGPGGASARAGRARAGPRVRAMRS